MKNIKFDRSKFHLIEYGYRYKWSEVVSFRPTSAKFVIWLKQKMFGNGLILLKIFLRKKLPEILIWEQIFEIEKNLITIIFNFQIF